MAKGKIGKKIEDLKYATINSWIYYNYYHGDIDENLVYVESVNGKDFSGNVFRIVEELTKGDYGKLRIVVYAKKEIQPMIRKLQIKSASGRHRAERMPLGISMRKWVIIIA